jgi:TRAP-type C4-dicarboxylate transport system permease small subunit
MLKKLADWVSVLNRLGKNVAGVGLFVMVGLVTADVIMRRLFNAPIIFADEVSGYLLVLVTLMGVSYTLQDEGHIQVKLILNQISPKKRNLFKLLWCVIGIVYAVILLYMTSKLTWESFHLKAFSPTPSQLPLFPAQVFMPIGCLLLLFQLIVELLDSLFVSRRHKPLQNSTRD